MIRRINKFIILLLIVAMCLYIVVLNSGPLTVYLTPSMSISSHVGIILVGTFFLGATIIGLLGVTLGIRAYWRERRIQRQLRQSEAFFKDFIDARNSSSIENSHDAQEKWHKIIRREKNSPAATIARIELAKVLVAANNSNQALKILDEARSIDPDNIEVLSYTAKLQESLGNKTASIDNLALLMYQGQTKYVAKKLLSLSEDLGRIEDALEYNKQLQRLGDKNKEASASEKRLRYKLLLQQNKEDTNTLQKELLSLIGQFGDFAEPLMKLGELSETEGRIDEAAQYFIRAARASGQPVLWHNVAKFWLRHNNPERAVAAARAASNESKEHAKIPRNIDLARLYLTLNMPEDALKVVEETLALLGKENSSWGEFNFLLSALKGLCLMRLDRQSEAESIWKQLGRYDESWHISLLQD
ncbi:MAG: DUF1049 domain-containing protein [SAR324 cluster bacterium]|uniref:DUF1049 domain-containing protein n=1 Tax=SAR324 cluster bacterium TaxID=2024889 RepID=A0A7X9FTF0_9DELT|nr:DUF1049 domain-containing protein [SAR324 cluster bacterium]